MEQDFGEQSVKILRELINDHGLYSILLNNKRTNVTITKDTNLSEVLPLILPEDNVSEGYVFTFNHARLVNFTLTSLKNCCSDVTIHNFGYSMREPAALVFALIYYMIGLSTKYSRIRTVQTSTISQYIKNLPMWKVTDEFVAKRTKCHLTEFTAKLI